MNAITTAVFCYGLRQPVYKFVPRGMKFAMSESKEAWNLQQDRFAWPLCLRFDNLLDGLSNLCRSKISPIWRGFAVLQSAVRGGVFRSSKDVKRLFGVCKLLVMWDIMAELQQIFLYKERIWLFYCCCWKT